MNFMPEIHKIKTVSYRENFGITMHNSCKQYNFACFKIYHRINHK
jgi:hypothetical protein